jgi:anhydro-N-acetylmuramic acid kinase
LNATATPARFAGVMTGTSLDAIDVAVLEIAERSTLGNVSQEIQLKHFQSHPLDRALVAVLMDLQSSGHDELHRAALAANSLADAISRCLLQTLQAAGLSPQQITAVGVHGQTVRHQPALGYTLQLNSPARIAEIAGITVVSDFRSRDVAAGGQGAPLVPAFHRALFTQPGRSRAVVNVGGMANLSWLGSSVTGFDTGPGNALMDLWVQSQQGTEFDEGGRWAASGHVSEPLLSAMLSDPFFHLPHPKSTGRDHFNPSWLAQFLSRQEFNSLSPQDVQATLLALTANSIALELAKLDACETGGALQDVLVCGGGEKNTALMHSLGQALRAHLGREITVRSTAQEGWDPQVVEAAAFAWLAYRTHHHLSGNLPAVTGALGERVLGSITPA